MNGVRGVLYLVGTIALCACGRADDSYRYDDEMELRSDDGGVLNPGGRPSGGGWLGNGLEDPDLGGVDPAFSLSSSAGLSDAAGLLLDPDLMGTAEYLVECALPYGTSITKTVEGQTVVLDGLLGLAPEWETGECDEDCQEWVSACLLARTNVSGQVVRIWMKADHEAVGWEAPAGALFEAAFYGNLFDDPEAQYYCKGSSEGLVAAQREGRTCTSGSSAMVRSRSRSCRPRLLPPRGERNSSDGAWQGGVPVVGQRPAQPRRPRRLERGGSTAKPRLVPSVEWRRESLGIARFGLPWS